MILYHGTPYQFSVLNKCSWLATSPEEAAAHLVLKNVELKNEDYTSGFILEVEVDDVVIANSEFYYHPTPGHYLSLEEHPVRKSTPLKDLIDTFEGPMRFIGQITQTWDLTPYIRGD